MLQNNIVMQILDKVKSEISNIEQRTDLNKDQKIEQICVAFGTTCGIVAAQPIPFADFFILTPIQIYMGKKIADIHGYRIEELEMGQIFKELTATVGMGLLSQQLVIGLYKFIPFLGSVTTIPIVFGMTYAMGKVMNYYFDKKKKGEQISSEEIKKIFRVGKDAGENIGKQKEMHIKENAKKTYQKENALPIKKHSEILSEMIMKDFLSRKKLEIIEEVKESSPPVYLTKASFMKLCKSKSEVLIDKGDLHDIFRKYIIDDYRIYKIFTSNEIKKFIAQLYFLKDNPEAESIKVQVRQFNKVSKEEDSYKYIYNKGGAVKYHLYNDCELMKKTYIDYRVPQEFEHLIEPENLEEFLIKNGKTLEGYIRRLRHYELFENDETRKNLNEYEDILQKYEEVSSDEEYRKKAVNELRALFINSNDKVEFIERIYNKEWLGKYIGLKKLREGYFEGFKQEKYNSGHTGDTEFDYKDMIEKLQNIIINRTEICNLQILDKYISKYDYLYDKDNETIKAKLKELDIKDKIFLQHYTISQLKDFWKNHRILKDEATHLIDKYIQWKYDLKQKEFTEEMMKKYGLECCVFCENRRQEK